MLPWLENGAVLVFILQCYKDKKVFNKAVDSYYHALRFVVIAIRPKNV